MNFSKTKKYISQHIELFGDEIYNSIDEKFKQTSTNLNSISETLDIFKASTRFSTET